MEKSSRTWIVLLSYSLCIYLVQCQNDLSLKLANSANCFTLDLYKQLISGNQNMIASPFSADVLLSILRIGSGGETAKQLVSALGYQDLSTQDIAAAFKNDLSTISTTSQNVTLTIANSMFIQKNFKISKQFNDTITNSFDAAEMTADFRNQPDQAKQAINTWASQKTHGLIPTLFEQNLLPNTVLVLLNAIYFKGNWEKQFNKTNTQNGDFFNDGTDKSSVPLMNQQNKFNYKNDNDLQAEVLEMDYEGGNISMVVVLPFQSLSFSNFENNLTCNSFRSTLDKLYSYTVDVTMPKFDISSDFDDLKEPLKRLNITDAFVPGLANFSAISSDGLYVSKAIQKAVVKVDEEGSVAAAVSAIVVGKLLIAGVPEPIIYFKANHPFVFFIRHKVTNLILFMGRVASL